MHKELKVGLQLLIPSQGDTPPHSLKNSNASPKVETMEKRVEVHFLARSTLGVEGHARDPGWGLG
jgi:hypothetical protein